MEDRVAGVGQPRMRKAERQDLDFELEGGVAVTLHWGENQELLGLGWKRSGHQLSQLSLQEQGSSERGSAWRWKDGIRGRRVCRFCSSGECSVSESRALDLRAWKLRAAAEHKLQTQARRERWD